VCLRGSHTLDLPQRGPDRLVTDSEPAARPTLTCSADQVRGRRGDQGRLRLQLGESHRLNKPELSQRAFCWGALFASPWQRSVPGHLSTCDVCLRASGCGKPSFFLHRVKALGTSVAPSRARSPVGPYGRLVTAPLLRTVAPDTPSRESSVFATVFLQLGVQVVDGLGLLWMGKQFFPVD
jgi:hypothetical protein